MRGVERGEGRRSYRRVWKIAAAVAVLAVAVPSGVYAASHYWSIDDFFANNDHILTKDAEKLIEKDVVQTKDSEVSQELPVNFKVKETLCDSGSVDIVLEAKAKEKGKYLLVPKSCSEFTPVSDLGINEDKMIGEYAESKGLLVLYIGWAFDESSEFQKWPYISDYSNPDHDTMEYYMSFTKESDMKDLDMALRCTVRAASGDITTHGTLLNFTLQDKSSSVKASYVAEGKMAVKSVGAVITKITMEKLEVNTYVKVYYRYEGKTEEEILDDGLFFRIKDEKGERWDMMNGRGGHSLGNGKYCCSVVYNSIDLPEKCILEAFDCMETNVIFNQFTISKVK